MNFEDLKKTISVAPASERRKVLIESMRQLIDSGRGCASCQGYCCTFSYNSMRVTPLETLDLYEFLKSTNRINSELIDSLNKTIKDYRLDKEIYLGNGQELRRQYTCPFFNAGPKGCSIGLEWKPYGCLAFNALEKNVSVEGKCSSDQKLLERRELEFNDEEMASHKISEALNLLWQRKSMPVALLEFIHLLHC